MSVERSPVIYPAFLHYQKIPLLLGADQFPLIIIYLKELLNLTVMLIMTNDFIFIYEKSDYPH